MDARVGGDSHRAHTGVAEQRELLAGEVCEQRAAAAVAQLLGQPHGGADRDELDGAGRPVVGALVDPHRDHGVGAAGLRLLEQPPERQPAALVVGARRAPRTSVGTLKYVGCQPTW